MSQGWLTRPLGEVCERITVGHVGITAPYYCDEGILFLRTQNVSRSGLVLDDARYITPEFHASLGKSEVKGGDILMSRVITHTVNCALVPNDLGPANCANVVLVRPGQAIAPEFLAHYIRSPAAQKHLMDRKVGSAQLVVNTTVVKEWPVPIPPLPEQQRIVALLDEALAGLATAKANAERNLENARLIFESHLQTAFGGREEGWIVTTLDQISTNLDSRRIPITKSARSSGQYPYYGASGIVDYVADFIFEGDNLLVSEDGANLLARSTPIAFSVSGRYWVNNHAHILHFNDMATQRYVEFYLESIRLDEYITGAAQPKLNQKALNAIPIPIPEAVDEQARIVLSIEKLQEETQCFVNLYERKLAALEELKQSLLQQAFNGEL